jgi:hypothetical protein
MPSQKRQGKVSMLQESKDAPLIPHQEDIRHGRDEVVAVLSSLLNIEKPKLLSIKELINA